ncbi:MAG: TldD/PmbA family protein [Victivallaceae bacterium]
MLDLKQYQKYFSGYTELRLQENRSYNTGLLNGDCVNNSKSTSGGIFSRSFKNGAWGAASGPLTGGEPVEKIIANAISNAGYLGSRVPRKSELVMPDRNLELVKDFSGTEKRYSEKEKMAFLKEIDNYIASKYPQLKSRRVFLEHLEMQKHLLTSTGSSAWQLIPRTYIKIVMALEKAHEPVELGEPFGGLGQMEELFDEPSRLFGGIDRLYDNLAKKADAGFASAGVKEVILDADLAGILAHEAIGHTTEADIVMSGSAAGDYLNRQVASPLVTLIDYANTAFGKICPQPVYIDDEGVEAKDAVIIENGILKGFMHNRESAAHFGHEVTGNARAFAFNDEPLIRMRNTCIVPGKDKLADMIASIEDGYYLVKCNNGQADSTSEFMFGVSLGFEIRNGRLGRAIKDTTISGVAFELLKTVSMVSDDLKWLSSGMCGKKQLIPVGMGGPAIKCKVNIGGK